MDTWLNREAPAPTPAPMQKSAPLSAPQTVAETKEDQARAAYAEIAKPVTEATFMAWYMKTHNKKAVKRAAEGEVAPSTVKRVALEGAAGGAAAAPPAAAAAAAAAAAPPAAPKASKGKTSALVKGLVKSLKSAIKGKRWHQGDFETLSGSVVMSVEDFKSIFAGITLISDSPTITSFSLPEEALKRVFGTELEGVSVKTFSRPRNFRKSWPTGAVALEFDSATGKYSNGTSTCTIKFSVSCGGGSLYDGFW